MALKTFWTDQLTIYKDEQTAAQHDLTAAQKLQKNDNTKLAADLKLLDQATSSIAAMRAQLAVTTVPANAQALIVKITAKIIEQRGLQGTVLDDQDALADATASVDAANATLSRAKARVASVTATLAQATADDAKRDALKAASTAPPLSSLKGDATTFLKSPTVTHASARLGKNFPPEIVTIAGKRHGTRAGRVASLETALHNAQDALGAELATADGLQGAVARAQIDFQRAQSALSQYVSTAADRFTKAQTVMEMLAAIEAHPATVPDVLTDAEKAQLFSPAAIAKAGAKASGVADPVTTTTQNAVDKAAADKVAADKEAAAQDDADGAAALEILAAGEAAAKAAAVGASQADKDAAKQAADDAAAAQGAAVQVAAEKTLADGTAAQSAQDAQTAIDGAVSNPNAWIIGICLDAAFKAQYDLDAQILTQINTDVDQLSTAPALATKRAAITTATTTYTTAISTFAAAASPDPKKADLDQWEVVIPDSAWKVLLDFEEGLAALNELSTADSASDLATAMSDKETAYTDALAAAELAQRKADALGDAIALRAKRLADAQAALANRLPSAIRGDSY
jgi:hypothetical protein